MIDMYTQTAYNASQSGFYFGMTSKSNKLYVYEIDVPSPSAVLFLQSNWIEFVNSGGIIIIILRETRWLFLGGREGGSLKKNIHLDHFVQQNDGRGEEWGSTKVLFFFAFWGRGTHTHNHFPPITCDVIISSCQIIYIFWHLANLMSWGLCHLHLLECISFVSHISQNQFHVHLHVDPFAKRWQEIWRLSQVSIITSKHYRSQQSTKSQFLDPYIICTLIKWTLIASTNLIPTTEIKNKDVEWRSLN